jgi:ferredoxin-fold anticodon binding domain-containing protein
LETLYSLDGAVGKDIDVNHTRYTLNGYFPRIKNINTQYQILSTQKNNLSLELAKINANLVVAENLKTAANSTLEEVTEDFLKLTGVLPT